MGKKQRYYDWAKTFSYQTGSQGELCIVVGAKDIGKTFGLRLACVKDYLKRKRRFCEICRTEAELKAVRQGYFDKLQGQGFFEEHVFQVKGQTGMIAKLLPPDEDDYDESGQLKEDYKPKHTPWETLCYFVALTSFQREKKRTYENVYRYVFDEGLIDSKDRYHRYLPNEYLILANLLDSISRQQPGGAQYRVYILGNACDLTAPYLRYAGVDKIPEYGYSFYNDKHTLLHYVEPWDAGVRKRETLVGHMLNGFDSEAAMVFENKFDDGYTGDLGKKTAKAKYAFGVRYGEFSFAVWIDYSDGYIYVNRKPPKDARNMVALTKKDATIDYQGVTRASPYMQMISNAYYAGDLRYDSAITRELFFSVLDFLGIK